MALTYLGNQERFLLEADMNFNGLSFFRLLILWLCLFILQGCEYLDTDVDDNAEKVDSNGLLIAVMGNFKDSQDPFARGVKMAAEEINLAGGIGGRNISLVYRNSGCSDSVAEYQAETLLEKYPNIVAVAGPECSGAGGSVNAIMGSEGIPIIAFTTSSPSLSLNDNFYRLQSSDVTIAASFVDAILDQQSELSNGNYNNAGASANTIKLAILYNDDAYTAGLASGIQTAFNAATVPGLTLEISEFDSFTNGEVDFSTEIDDLNIDTHGIDVIAFMGFRTEIANFSQNLASTQGYDAGIPIYVPNLKDTVLEEGNENIIVNMRALTPNGAIDENVFPNLSDFLLEFNNRYSSNETQEDAAQGYDAMMLIGLSLLQGHSDGDMDVNTDTTSVIRAGILTNLTDVSRGAADFEDSESATLYIEPGEYSIAVSAFSNNDTQDLNYNGASGYIDFDSNGDINYGAYYVQKVSYDSGADEYVAENLELNCYGPAACVSP